MKEDVKRIRVELDTAASGVIGKLQARALQAITSANPVDTGFSRAGWTPAVGFPVALLEGPRPSDEKAAKAAARKARAQNTKAGQQILKTYRIQEGSVFLSNAVDYVPALNGGSSAQAAAMFVQRGIAQAIRSVQRTTKRIDPT